MLWVVAWRSGKIKTIVIRNLDVTICRYHSECLTYVNLFNPHDHLMW